MAKQHIVVIGSSNTDMVIRSERLPQAGETVLGEDLIVNPGGKGANQAVAAAKLGGDVVFIAKVGEDAFGDEAIAGFSKHGIDIQHIGRDPERASGVALILVDASGENCISVALGANNNLAKEDIDAAQSALAKASHVLMQLESPLDTIEYAARSARAYGSKVILNPAPAQDLPDSLLGCVDIITPNETEAEFLTGIKVVDASSARVAAKLLVQRGVSAVIITMGEQGAFVYSNAVASIIPAERVKATDTTAAGDTFNGALVVALAENRSLVDAVQLANKAASITVTRMGAQQAIPSRSEVDKIKS